MGAILLIAVVAMLVVAGDTAPQPIEGTELTQSDKDAILAAHNKLRGTVNPPAKDMATMVWNNQLAQYAQSVADKCNWGHSSQTARKNLAGFWYVGENLAAEMGTRNFVGEVQMWFDERKSYDYNTGKCTATCGHYTQVVWAKSKDLGCAARKCNNPTGLPWPDALLLVCNYGPGGNTGGKPYVSA